MSVSGFRTCTQVELQALPVVQVFCRRVLNDKGYQSPCLSLSHFLLRQVLLAEVERVERVNADLVSNKATLEGELTHFKGYMRETGERERDSSTAPVWYVTCHKR